MFCVEEKLVIRLLTFMCLTSYFLYGQAGCTFSNVFPQGTTNETTTPVNCNVEIRSSVTSRKEGKFHSPGWAQQYHNNKRCVYKFVGLYNERVKISFNSFNIQGMKPECRYDYVDIYIELSSPADNLLDANVLGRFCGDSLEDLPKLLISTHNVIVIVFFSDETKNDIGFEGNYEFVDDSIYNAEALKSPTSCTYSISSRDHKRGHIMSPTYPGIYPDNTRCTYIFTGLAGERIKLNFLDFSLFHGGEYCPFDYIIVKDGRDSNAQDIGVFCGTYKDVTLFSTREILYIEFVTRNGRVSFDRTSLYNSADYSFDRRGFNISFEFSDTFVHLDLRNSPDASHVIGTECDVRIVSRGGSNGTFKSPGYPSNFSRYAVCRYFLDGEMNFGRLEKVEVNFRDFVLPGNINENCTQGYLGVSKQGHRDSQRIDERFCGTLWPPKLVSTDPRMILTFRTMGATQARFVAAYRFLEDYGIPGNQIDDGCNFSFESKSKKRGTINSPRHPTNYPPGMECTYIFKPDGQNERLLISFIIFSLNPESANDTTCSYTDFVELYKLNPIPGSTKYALVGRYCGTNVPAPILSQTEIKLRFKSFMGSGHLGFNAKYEYLDNSQLHHNCGKLIYSDGSGGLIQSPNYPLKYKAYSYCEWRIQASKRENKILVEFETLKMEGTLKAPKGEGGCKDAVLQVINGDSVRELCGLFDDNELDQHTALSTGNVLTLRFISSSKALGATGFQISWTEVHEGSQCYGFKCKISGYCISSDLKCNKLPNCGPRDTSDETCSDSSRASDGPAKAKVQILHIAIGTSISIFFCVVLLICGVYHRKKFRTRDRHGMDHDQVEVRYVAATSGSNTTDRLLTLDKTPEQTQVPDQTDNQVTPHHNNQDNNSNNDQTKQNHNSLPHENSKQPRPVTAPKIQKISIV